MSWRISNKIADILSKGSDDVGIDREEALLLYLTTVILAPRGRGLHEAEP